MKPDRFTEEQVIGDLKEHELDAKTVDPKLRDRLLALARERRRFGYRRLLIFLRRPPMPPGSRCDGTKALRSTMAPRLGPLPAPPRMMSTAVRLQHRLDDSWGQRR